VPKRISRALRAPLAAILILAGAAPATVPAAQAQRASAASEHQQLVQEFGGEMQGQLGALVDALGGRITAQANARGRINPDFTLLNSPVANAFATPSGRVYVTRQLLALMNSEDELAFVLGHEAAHIAANHSRERQTGSVLTQLGAAILGAVTGSSLASQLAGVAGQSYLAGFSRSQELESDRLGLRYMAANGYNPLQSAEILDTLNAYGTMQARFSGREDDQRSAPSWNSTHPTSAQRVAQIRREAQRIRTPAAAAAQDRYFNMIDGMLFDDDPRQGVIEGRTFRHPDLRFAFDAPQGYGIQNGTTAVSVRGRDGQAIFSVLPFNGDLEEYALQAVRRHIGQAQAELSQPERMTINGLPAVAVQARARTQNGVADLTVVAYQFSNDQAYYMATLTQGGRGSGAFGPMFQSVRRLTNQEAAAIRPRVIDIVTVGARDTVDTLARRMAYTTYQAERFRVLNGLTAGETVRPGQRVKLVVYGTPTR
jgi:predicted Zn-dependent protease